MPRKYTRKTTKASWTKEQLEAALNAIANGLPERQAATKFNIPRSTLQDRRKNKNISTPSLGRNPIFSPQAENELAGQVKKLANLYFGLTMKEVKRCAFIYAKSNNIQTPFNQEKEEAGKDWVAGFMSRHSIVLRKPEGTSINRITAFNREEVSILWKNLRFLMEKYRFSPQRIFNCDETGITTVQRPSKIFAAKGQRRVGFVTSWERGKTTTVMCAFSASGTYVPPMFIYARKRMAPQLKRNGPPGAVYECSDNGWITEELFVTWLKHFQSTVKSSQDDPVLLVLDNHVSHCTLQAYIFCKENGIIVLTIPPHTSHRLQPLDVSFYSSLKSAYHNECDKFLTSHPGEKITPNEVAELFSKAYSRVATPEKAIKGFSVTGLFPFNPDVFTEEDFAPAENLQRNSEHRDFENSEVRVNETTPEKVTSLDNEVNKTVSFTEIITVPSCSKIKTAKSKRKSSKQHSVIFTSTPLKEALELKQSKKNTKPTKNAKRNVFQEKIQISAPRKKSRRSAPLINYEEDKENEEIETEDDDSDKDVNEDICIVCGEFGKNGEIWLRCVICGQWAHKACSNSSKEKKFICDFCS